MSALQKLKFVSAQADVKSPSVLRRNRLTGKLQDQISLAKALASGSTYVSKRRKVVTDEATGQRIQVEIDSLVKPWWWTAASGKVMLALRYGSKNIEFSKGKNAIEIASGEELVGALEALKEAVAAGELDAQIEQVSGTLRAAFKK